MTPGGPEALARWSQHVFRVADVCTFVFGCALHTAGWGGGGVVLCCGSSMKLQSCYPKKQCPQWLCMLACFNRQALLTPASSQPQIHDGHLPSPSEDSL